MARVVVRRRKDGKSKGTLVRASGAHASVKIDRVKAARVRRNRSQR